MNVVELAKQGFGTGASQYDKNRPTYTDQVVELVVKELNHTDRHSCDYNILELGAGTGKFTERLAPNLPQNMTYLASEPSRNFLDLLEAKSLPSVKTVTAAANAIPLPDVSVGNIVCAQSFHWFSNEESLKEMHRVLVPGGKLFLIWNAKNYDAGCWTREMYKQRLDVLKRVGGSTAHWYNTMEWREALENACSSCSSTSSLFTLTQHSWLPGVEMKGSLDDVLANISTVSSYNSLPEAERSFYLDKMRQAILACPDVEDGGATLTMPYSSEVYVYTKAKPASC